MKTTDFITEHNAFIAQDAGEMHSDHEVQMARADCYHAADYAIKLHKILAQANDNGNIEGWVSEKITLANDYLRTVYEYLSYEDKEVDLHAMPTFAFESAEAQLQAALEEGYSMADVQRDAEANARKSVDRMTAPQEKTPFMAQVGKKIVGGVTGAVKGAYKGFTGQVNEVDPRNFDSDEDYYAARNAPAKQRHRGQQTPGVNPDDEAYFREIFRKKRAAAAKAQQDGEQGVAEGQLNEYLVKAGMPVKDVLALNLFQDFDPVEGAAAQFPEFAQEPMWQQVVRKYAPIANMLEKKLLAQKRRLTDAEAEAVDETWYDGSDAYDDMEIEYLIDIYNQQIDTLEALLAGNLTDEEFLEQGVAEGVAETMPLNDAVKVLRQYGADNFKTTSNELHFYKNGRPLRVDLIWNSDTTRSVSISQLNAATRSLKGQGVAEGKQTVSEMTAGGTGAGGFATGPAGGTGKPGTGVPKRVKNVAKRLTPKIGTGIYK